MSPKRRVPRWLAFNPRHQRAEQMQVIEYARGFIIFLTTLGVGVAVLVSGYDGRLHRAPSWDTVLTTFPVNFQTWGSILVVIGLVGSLTVLGPEWTRVVEVWCAALAGLWFFLMFALFTVAIFKDPYALYTQPVVWLSLSTSATIRSLTHIKRLS